MKNPAWILAFLLAGGVMFLSGCGKSAEEKKAEGELNERIMKGHEAQMAAMRRTEGLVAQIDSAIAGTDSLIAGHPREAAGYNTSALISARDRLIGSRNAMESWMQNWTPYNEGIKHDLAMTQLQGDLNTLMQVQEQMGAAESDVTKALTEQRQWKDSILTAAGRKRR